MIDTELVRDLIAGQFPQWAELPVHEVDRQGWDNRTYRLGEELTVRLPSADGYVAAVAKEDRWLPELAPHLPLPVPSPVAVGRPTGAFPRPWSVRRWLPGTPLDAGPVTNIAEDLGAFLTALRQAPAAGGPAAGQHSFYRGCHPSVYGAEVDAALDLLDLLDEDVDEAACRRIWRDALVTAWPHDPVWVHGDIAAGNLLVQDGRLGAVIDFGTCSVGDPACDLQIAWTYFPPEERQAFRAAVALPPDAWARARGWALWKELVSLAGMSGSYDTPTRRTLDAVLSDPVA